MDFAQKSFDPNAKGPLDGVRVLDMTRLVAGNMLSLQLADFGAEVIKLEMLPKGDPLRAWNANGIQTNWKVYGRNKKSVSLNFREKDGLDLLLKLDESTDVFVENMKPGRIEEMGIGPDVLLERNPDLVIARVTGFGQTGPYSSQGGFGTVVEAMSGFAAMNGFADRVPVLPPLALADMIAGLYGAMSVMIALREKEVNGGKGQVIDLSLLEPIFSILGPQAASYKITGQVPQRTGSGSNTTSPRNAYATSDGGYVALSGSIQTMAERLFRVIGRDDMNSDPKFKTNADRVANRAEVDDIVGEWIDQQKFKSIEDLSKKIKKLSKYDVILVPAALSDFVPEKNKGKISSQKIPEIKLKKAKKVIELLRKKHKGKLCAFKLESGLTDNKLIEKGKTLLKNADIVVANHSEVLGDENTKLAIITKKDNIWIEDTKINASKQILKEIIKKI